METIYKLISPYLAKIYLSKMKINRPLREDKVDQYAEVMRAGQWCEEIHQGIAFNKNGELVDGQHRLHALIKANMILSFSITTGVGNDAFMCMDSGATRSTSNIMAIIGVKNYAVHAASIQQYFAFKKGLISDRKIVVKNTSQDVVEFYNANFELCNRLESIASTCYNKRRLITKSFVYSFMLKLILIDGKRESFAEKFFLEMFGITPSTNSSTQLLADRLIKVALSKLSLPKREVLALMIKAFNNYQSGANIRTLRWNEEAEGFPIIH